MSLRFGSPEWARGLMEQINASSEYRQAASGWGVGFDGSLLLGFEPDGKAAEVRRLRLLLAAGACEAAEFVAGDAPAAFVLRAPFGLWRDVLERRTLAATAILSGKMQVGGDKLTLLRYAAAHRALIACVASMDTAWD